MEDLSQQRNFTDFQITEIGNVFEYLNVLLILGYM